MTILVDMDDTMTDLLGTWTKYINRMFGVYVPKEEIISWDMQKAYPTLSKEQIFAPLFDERLWVDVRPLQGAAECLNALIQLRHSVFVVTASHYDTVGMKIRNVLLRYFPFVSYDNVIVTKNKQLLLGDVLIDDNPRNLLGGQYKGILIDAPYNQQFDEQEYGVVRVHNWEEIYDTILKM